jgi:hypothetical protein
MDKKWYWWKNWWYLNKLCHFLNIGDFIYAVQSGRFELLSHSQLPSTKKKKKMSLRILASDVIHPSWLTLGSVLWPITDLLDSQLSPAYSPTIPLITEPQTASTSLRWYWQLRPLRPVLCWLILHIGPEQDRGTQWKWSHTKPCITLYYDTEGGHHGFLW